ncbi:MAG: type II toxin-antitoxin system VapC family toxin [Acidobacteriota bacterium]
MEFYFDTSYVAKCYLNEQGSADIRALAQNAAGLASLAIAQVEFHSAVRRHVIEKSLTSLQAASVLANFESDLKSGTWEFYPVTTETIQRARQGLEDIPSDRVLRAADALHLACAAENDCAKFYSDDRRQLAAAPYFGLEGLNLLAQDSNPGGAE